MRTGDRGKDFDKIRGCDYRYLSRKGGPPLPVSDSRGYAGRAGGGDVRDGALRQGQYPAQGLCDGYHGKMFL